MFIFFCTVGHENLHNPHDARLDESFFWAWSHHLIHLLGQLRAVHLPGFPGERTPWLGLASVDRLAPVGGGRPNRKNVGDKGAKTG